MKNFKTFLNETYSAGLRGGQPAIYNNGKFVTLAGKNSKVCDWIVLQLNTEKIKEKDIKAEAEKYDKLF